MPSKVWDLLATDPRESNQDGGLFPGHLRHGADGLPHGRLCVFPWAFWPAFTWANTPKKDRWCGWCALPSTIWPGSPRSSTAFSAWDSSSTWSAAGSTAGCIPSGSPPANRSFGTGLHSLGQPDARPADDPGGDRVHRGGVAGDPAAASAKVPTPWERPSSRRWCACSFPWLRRA